jgi:hypothetical protein
MKNAMQINFNFSGHCESKLYAAFLASAESSRNYQREELLLYAAMWVKSRE